MRISYWSSDVCSSVLPLQLARPVRVEQDQRVQVAVAGVEHVGDPQAVLFAHPGHPRQDLRQLPARDGAVHAHVDRKSTRLNSVTNAHLVCRLLLEKKKYNTIHANMTHTHTIKSAINVI